ncbi:MAG: hypothetical protein WD431_10770 [Cyclobacteriaceae bacterium]
MDLSEVVSYLKEIGFEGNIIIENIIIECEISGNKNDYIMKTKKYLENLIGSTG